MALKGVLANREEKLNKLIGKWTKNRRNNKNNKSAVTFRTQELF
jgi:hypothetical protein